MRTKKERAEHFTIKKLNAPSIQTVDPIIMNSIDDSIDLPIGSVFQSMNESLSNRPIFEEGVKIDISLINLEAL